MEVMGLTLWEFNDYTIRVTSVLTMPQSGTVSVEKLLIQCPKPLGSDMLKQTGILRWLLVGRQLVGILVWVSSTLLRALMFPERAVVEFVDPRLK